MAMGEISLDSIRADDQFNFQSIYEQDFIDDVDEERDSLYEESGECEYLEPDEFNTKSNKYLNSTSYFHLNCRSLSSNWDSFKSLLCELQCNNFSFDYIGISEIFSCDRDSRLILPGYHDLLSRTRSDDRHGGVGLFIKDTINYKVREDLSVFIPHVFESLFIEIISESTNTKQSCKIVGVIYKPNTQPRVDMDIFSVTLYDIMDIINNENKMATIIGDFNVDLLKYNTHEKTNEYVDNIFTRGFIPQITKPTRISSNSATLIDHIYSNLISSSISGIIVTDVADHFGIYHITSQRNKEPKQPKLTKRFFSENNINKLNKLLLQTNFAPAIQQDPNEAYNIFFKIYKEKFDMAFPVKESIKHRLYIKQEPWMTRGLLTSLKTKTKLLQKKLNEPSLENIQSYKLFLNTYNKIKKLAKAKYYIEMIEINKNNIKNTWTIIKKAIGKVNNKTSVPKNCMVNNKLSSNSNEIADSFNTFFAKIGKSTSENVPLTDQIYTNYLKNPSIGSIYVEPVTQLEILKIVNRLKAKTSFGHDEIPTKIVKKTIFNILQPLTYIINRSLDKGIFPDKLKIAKIIPIYKSLDPTLQKNYRPVSLLPTFSKIYEKVMFNKLLSYLNSNNMFYKHQYGFRPNCSTIHPILHLLNECASSSNAIPKAPVLSILCDLSKAFDVIDHKILIRKLEHYGIRGVAKNWIEHYLKNRLQFVEINRTKSDICRIECGVPQGSILGPLLYLIYVNDIGNCTNSTILSFADDTTLNVSDANPLNL